MKEYEIIMKRISEKDSRIVTVRYYKDGFVSNSYKWRAPGKCMQLDVKTGVIKEFSYDKKRSYGKGPTFVGYSEKGGRLYSE